MKKTSDFELLIALQNELINILEERKSSKKWISKCCCKAKIRRLRLQIQEIMFRIENKCTALYKNENEKEGWE